MVSFVPDHLLIRQESGDLQVNFKFNHSNHFAASPCVSVKAAMSSISRISSARTSGAPDTDDGSSEKRRKMADEIEAAKKKKRVEELRKKRRYEKWKSVYFLGRCFSNSSTTWSLPTQTKDFRLFATNNKG